MRHNKHNKTLGVTKEHRSAMLANMAASLIKKGRIQTTLAKARALRPFVEKIITLAKTGTLHTRRIAMSRVRDTAAIDVLFDDKVKQFAKRNGGYTRIYKLATRRLGDAAEMALIEFVGADDPGYKKSRGKKAKKQETAPAETPAEAAPAEAAKA